MTNETTTADVTSPSEMKIPPAILKAATRRARERAENLRAAAQRSIRYHADSLKEESDNLAKAEEKAKADLTKWAEALAKLKQAGIRAQPSNYNLDILVKTTQQKVVDISRVLGALDETTLDKDIADAKKGTVHVRIRSLRYPTVKVVYVRKLTSEDKCKIVEDQVPAKVEYRLVCER